MWSGLWPWPNRNFIIHQYDEINRERTWQIISFDLPAWRASLQLLSTRKGISEVKLSHTPCATFAVFDDPNLVSSSAGPVPMLALADSAGLHELAADHLTVPTDKGANAG